PASARIEIPRPRRRSLYSPGFESLDLVPGDEAPLDQILENVDEILRGTGALLEERVTRFAMGRLRTHAPPSLDRLGIEGDHAGSSSSGRGPAGASHTVQGVYPEPLSSRS